MWHLGLCELCSKRPKPEVFLSHVVAVLQYLRHQYPQIVPIMWDDMLRSIDEKILCGKQFDKIHIHRMTVFHFVILKFITL